MKNVIKKAALLTLISIPVMATAGISPCITDPNGICGIPNGGGNPVPGIQVWVGGWYDSNGVYQTVSANSFANCESALSDATSGIFAIVSQCTRVS